MSFSSNLYEQVASTSHSLVPEGITFNSVDDFNIELGGQDDFKSNMMRYGTNNPLILY